MRRDQVNRQLAMTVQEVLENRRKCRDKLRGVIVAPPGEAPRPVKDTLWGPDGQLQVILCDDSRWPPDQLRLCSVWPLPRNCRPKKRHALNTPR